MISGTHKLKVEGRYKIHDSQSFPRNGYPMHVVENVNEVIMMDDYGD